MICHDIAGTFSEMLVPSISDNKKCPPNSPVSTSPSKTMKVFAAVLKVESGKMGCPGPHSHARLTPRNKG